MNGGRVDVWALIGNALARCSGILQSAFRLSGCLFGHHFKHIVEGHELQIICYNVNLE